jgi:hypothetical protein
MEFIAQIASPDADHIPDSWLSVQSTKASFREALDWAPPRQGRMKVAPGIPEKSIS